MKDTTDIIKRQILEFESEALQKFFKENILENFENAKALKIIYQTICEYLYLDKYILLEDYENIIMS